MDYVRLIGKRFFLMCIYTLSISIFPLSNYHLLRIIIYYIMKASWNENKRPTNWLTLRLFICNEIFCVVLVFSFYHRLEILKILFHRSRLNRFFLAKKEEQTNSFGAKLAYKHVDGHSLKILSRKKNEKSNHEPTCSNRQFMVTKQQNLLSQNSDIH